MLSTEYKKILNQINETGPFGKRSKTPKFLENFIQIVSPKSILDFGCGKGKLVEHLQSTYPNIAVSGHDPGNIEFDNSLDSVFVDLLISTDVLEHIEPEFIDSTLKYLSKKSRYVYHLIALSPSRLVLPDGRNAHLILESKEWWRKKFLDLGYNIIEERYMEHEKVPKGESSPKLIKKYFIMAVKVG